MSCRAAGGSVLTTTQSRGDSHVQQHDGVQRLCRGRYRGQEFYGEVLGINVSEDNGLLTLHLAGDRDTLVYPKADHQPASYTILNFPVADIDAAVDELTSRGDVRALRRIRPGWQGASPRSRRAADRLVHRSGGQHPGVLEQ